jgi:hypothetical protein
MKVKTMVKAGWGFSGSTGSKGALNFDPDKGGFGK